MIFFCADFGSLKSNWQSLSRGLIFPSRQLNHIWILQVQTIDVSLSAKLYLNRPTAPATAKAAPAFVAGFSPRAGSADSRDFLELAGKVVLVLVARFRAHPLYAEIFRQSLASPLYPHLAKPVSGRHAKPFPDEPGQCFPRNAEFLRQSFHAPFGLFGAPRPVYDLFQFLSHRSVAGCCANQPILCSIINTLKNGKSFNYFVLGVLTSVGVSLAKVQV
jgi:hypothetical protein